MPSEQEWPLPDEDVVLESDDTMSNIEEPADNDKGLQPDDMTVHELNVAVAEMVGVTVTTRDSPIGKICDRDTGGMWSPVSVQRDAEFAAARSGYHPELSESPMDICIALLKRT